jgi:hypothetical protein
MGAVARAQEPAEPGGEPLLRAQASLLAASDILMPSSTPPGPERVFAPILNAGVGLRSTRELRGWLLGADVSVSVGTGRSASDALSVKDNSSSLFARYRPWSWGEGEEASLTLFPLSSSRLRLGWSYPATLGGGAYVRRDAVSGLRAEVTRTRWYAFAAVKTPGRLAIGGQWKFAPMAGVGLAPLPSLRAEIQAGLVPRDPRVTPYPGLVAPITDNWNGSLDGLGELGSSGTGDTGHVRGLTARLLHQQGGPIGPSVDFGLRGRAPEVFEESFARERYPGGVAYSVSLEATHANLVLPAAQGVDGNLQTVELPALEASANALALEARVRWGWLRVHALALTRSAAFVVADDGALWGILRQAPEREPELGLTVGADYHLPEAGLTPGFVLRWVRPAALRNERDFGPTWVLLSPMDVRMGLPGGDIPSPVLSARASLKWDLVPLFAVVGEVSYTQNLGESSSEAGYWMGPPGTGIPSKPPRRGAGLGFNILFQARY